MTTIQDIHGVGYGPGNISHFGRIQKRGVRFDMDVVSHLMVIDVAPDYFASRVANRYYLLAFLRPLVVKHGKPAVNAIGHRIAF